MVRINKYIYVILILLFPDAISAQIYNVKKEVSVIDSLIENMISHDNDLKLDFPFFEDYSVHKDAASMISDKIKNAKSGKFRIAVVGDSFIESDILTCDLRETLQDIFGGGGVGFVPITSIVSKNRPTVKHTFSGWNGYTILKNNTPEVDSRFLISCSLSKPSISNAWVEYEMTKSKNNLENVDFANLFVLCERDTKIKGVINGIDSVIFDVKGSSNLQKIKFKTDSKISSLKLFSSSTDGVYWYGVSFESKNGVIVDNFTDRGSSGYKLDKLSYNLNKQLDSLSGYDMIILQYGLNICSKGVSNYTSYTNKMSSVVSHIKKIYPKSVIVLMGISDRCVQTNGQYVSMKETEDFISHQRMVSQKCNVVFWNTKEAMGGDGSIKYFVNKKWAAKDHIHLGFNGGKFVALKLAKAIETTINSSPKQKSIDALKNNSFVTPHIYYEFDSKTEKIDIIKN